MKRNMWILLFLLATVPALVQAQSTPIYEFYSTSVQAQEYQQPAYGPDESGSVSVSLPALSASRRNSDEWAAAYSDGESNHPGPKRIAPTSPGSNEEPTPVGDGLWALLLMAVLFGARIYRGKKAVRA